MNFMAVHGGQRWKRLTNEVKIRIKHADFWMDEPLA